MALVEPEQLLAPAGIRTAGPSSLCSMQRDCHLSQVYMGPTIPVSSHDDCRVWRRDLTSEAWRTSMMRCTSMTRRTSRSAPLMTANARPLPPRAMTPVVLATAALRQPAGEDRLDDVRGGCAPTA